jgi:hypothetical protein
MLTRYQRLQYGIQDAVQIFAAIFSKKPQNKIAVLLQEAILSAVSPVRLGVGKMLFSVLNSTTRRARRLTKFHFTLTIEGNRQASVQLELTFRLRESFKTSIQKRLAGATVPSIRYRQRKPAWPGHRTNRLAKGMSTPSRTRRLTVAA